MDQIEQKSNKTDIQIRLEMHKEITDELRDIYFKKNMDYGNSFSKSIEEFGILAGIIRIYDKFQRMKNLAKNNPERLVEDESLRDTIKDSINYHIMLLIELEKGED